MDFGEELEKILVSRGWGVNQLAMKSGVSAPSISRYISGTRHPKPNTIKKLADALRYPYKDLMKLAGYLEDDSDQADTENYNDASKTIKLIEEQAARMGLSPSDPTFKKMLSDAFELLRVARGKDAE